MAEYPSIVLTNAGLDMIAESQAGQNLIFTKLKIGDGLLGEGESISALTALKSPKLDIPIQGFLNQGNGQVRLRYLVDNSGVPVNQGFFAREVGVYAKIGESGEERLYAYTNGGNKVDWIPDKNTPMDAQIFDIFVLIGNAQNVTVVIDGSATYATVLDLEEHNTSLTAHANLLNLVFGNMKGVNAIVGNKTLTPADAGKYNYQASGAGTTTLPALSSVPIGAVFSFFCGVAGPMVVQRAGSDGIAINSSIVTSLTLNAGDTLILVAGPDFWEPIGGSAQMIAAGVIVSSGPGWVKFADGTLIQEGTIPATVAGGYVTVYYPISFAPGTPYPRVTTGTAATDVSTTAFNWGINASESYAYFHAYVLGAANIQGSTYIAKGRWKA